MYTWPRFPKDLGMSSWPLSTIYQWSLSEIPLPAEKGLSNLGSVPLRAGSSHPGPCPGKTVRSGQTSLRRGAICRETHAFFFYLRQIFQLLVCSHSRESPALQAAIFPSQAVTASHNASLCTDSGSGGGTRPLSCWQPPRAGPRAAHGAAGTDDAAGGTAGTTGQSGAVQKPVPRSRCHAQAHTQDEGPSSSVPP